MSLHLPMISRLIEAGTRAGPLLNAVLDMLGIAWVLAIAWWLFPWIYPSARTSQRGPVQ